jgi:hypothetical protein
MPDVVTSVPVDFGSPGVDLIDTELDALDLVAGIRRCKTKILSNATPDHHYWGRFDTNSTFSFLGDNRAVASKTSSENRINLYSEASRTSQGGAHAWAWENVSFAVGPADREGREVNVSLSASLSFVVDGVGSALAMNPAPGDAEARTRFQVRAYSKVGGNAPIDGGEHYDVGTSASSTVFGGAADRIDYTASKQVAMPLVSGPTETVSGRGPIFRFYARGKSIAEAEAFGGAGGSATTDVSEVDTFNRPEGSEYLEARSARVTIESPSNWYWMIGPGEGGANCQ